MLYPNVRYLACALFRLRRCQIIVKQSDELKMPKLPTSPLVCIPLGFGFSSFLKALFFYYYTIS